jgi:shikimate 5-dehydrogenase
MTTTFWFFGVTTGQSAMQRIYPRWMHELGIDSRLQGIDFPLNAPAADYRRAVERIAADPDSIGGLITTHKLNVLSAAADLFDGLDESARLLREVSCVYKRGGRLLGAALDDRTSSLALEALTPAGFWEHDGELLLLGAGGASIATTLGIHRAAAIGRPAPGRIRVTARSRHRLDELAGLHARLGFTIPVTSIVTSTAEEADAVVADLPARSLVVNATGMGKDTPGSPLSDAVVYPHDSIAWDMNYRGERPFLRQAEKQAPARNLTVVDGWDYFVYSWTHVVSVVHDVEIDGETFDRLSGIARSVMA